MPPSRDGTLNDAGYITEVVDLIVQYGDHSEQSTFHVTGIGRTTIILGHTWLVEHNPEIDWSTGKVCMNRCSAACAPNATADDTNRSSVGSADNSASPPRMKSCWKVHIKRSPKAGQNPIRPNFHQALHAHTRTIWIEVTDFLYASFTNTRQRSRPLRQYPRSSRKPQKGP